MSVNRFVMIYKLWFCLSAVMVWLSLVSILRIKTEYILFGAMFCLVNLIFYIAAAIGLHRNKLYGFYLLKAYAVLLVFGFPIGTVLGLLSLGFIKRRNVKASFVNSVDA